jgi:hypothetical protein
MNFELVYLKQMAGSSAKLTFCLMDTKRYFIQVKRPEPDTDHSDSVQKLRMPSWCGT